MNSEWMVSGLMVMTLGLFLLIKNISEWVTGPLILTGMIIFLFGLVKNRPYA